MAMKMDINSSVNVDPSRKLEVDGLSTEELKLDADMGLDETQTYHEQLRGRDKPNQHPISSVIGLRNELDAIRAYAETRGESAYDIAVRNGFVGTETEWLASLKGETGDQGENAPLLVIESTRGNVFKNNTVTTLLRVVVYYGSLAIRSMSMLKQTFGETARLEWYYQRMGEDVFHVMSVDDSRFTDEGFVFSISPWDVDTKMTFLCELVVD